MRPVVLVLLFLASGCRTLVDPIPVQDPVPVSLTILDPNGNPVPADFRVSVSDREFDFHWSGFTDQDGKVWFFIPLPGPFKVDVWPRNSELPAQRFYDVALDHPENSVRYELARFEGSVLLPTNWDFGTSSRVTFERNEIVEGEYRDHTVWARIDSEGNFASWSDGRAYSARIYLDGVGGEISHQVPDLVILDPDTPLELNVPLVPLQLAVQLGGQPPSFAAHVQLHAETTHTGGRRDLVEVSRILSPTIDTWVVPGWVRLQIVSGTQLPFLTRDLRFEATGPVFLNMELGDHRIDFNLDDGVATVPFAEVRFDQGEDPRTSHRAHVSTNALGQGLMYLLPGSYVVSARRATGDPWSIVAYLEPTRDSTVWWTLPDN